MVHVVYFGQLIDIFFGLWLFILSEAYRGRKLSDWRSRGWVGKAIIPAEVLVCAIGGLFPLAILLHFVGLF